MSSVSVGHAQAEVIVLTRTPADHAVAEQLGRTLEAVRVVEREDTSGRPAALLVDEALNAAAAGYVVVIDRDHARVHVLRPSDQTAVVRALAPDVIAHSHVAVALSAAEMLDWLGASPPAPAETQHAKERAEAQANATARTSLLLGADLEWRQASEADASFLRPSFVLEVQRKPARWPVWAGLSLRLSLPGSWERIATNASLGGPGRISYAVTDATLQGELGHDTGALTLLIALAFGITVQRADLYDATDRALSSDSRVATVAGLGIGVRHELAWGLTLSAGAEGQLALAPAHYRIATTPILTESPLRLLLRVGLCLRTAGL